MGNSAKSTLKQCSNDTLWKLFIMPSVDVKFYRREYECSKLILDIVFKVTAYFWKKF